MVLSCHICYVFVWFYLVLCISYMLLSTLDYSKFCSRQLTLVLWRIEIETYI